MTLISVEIPIIIVACLSNIRWAQAINPGNPIIVNIE